MKRATITQIPASLYRKLAVGAGILFLLALVQNAWAQEKQYLWPSHRMPHPQEHQIAAMTDISRAEGFQPDQYRQPYLEWYSAPEKPNGGCMILISGGSYNSCCDVKPVKMWKERLTAMGFQCVNLVYRTPRPKGIPFYQSAWEDGQRAVRLVRSEAAKRGFDPERIGTVSMSAGSHLALLLATSSQSRAYEPVDGLDSTACHINWAVVHAPAYATTDAEEGTKALQGGYGPGIGLSAVFHFDNKTCPMILLHGGDDPYSSNGSILVYQQLRAMGVPAELHIFPGKGHAVLGFDKAEEFLVREGFNQ